MSQFSGNLQALQDRVIRAANMAVTQAAMEIAKEAKYLVHKGTYGQHSNPGNPPNYQTGELYRSIRVASPYELGTPLTARVGSGKEAPQGKWMEYGATIRAKNVRFLPIPINLPAQIMLRRLGSRYASSAGVVGSLRVFNLKLIKKDGKAFLMEMTTKGKKIKKGGAVFVLKRSITIKPRPWLVPAAKLATDAARARFKAVFLEQMKAGAM